jgi:Concanavalin A-like lectin/glucanases superfamily
VSYDSVILADSPLGYYTLNGNVNDTSGNGHNGTATAITYGAGGIANDGSQAAVFNGSTSKIALNEPAPNGGGCPITLEFWAKPSSTSPIGMFDTAPNQANVLRQNAAGTVEWWNADPQINLSLPDTAWHYLVLVFRRSAGGNNGSRILDYYRDAALISSTGGGSTGYAWQTPNLGCINGNSSFYTGSIQKFAIYGVALNTTQISAHFAAAAALPAFQFAQIIN